MIWLIIFPCLIFMAFELYYHYYATNTALFYFINQNYPGSDWLWQNITFMGDGLPAFVLLILFSKRFPYILWCGLITELVTGVCAQLIKHIVHVMRPASILGFEHINIIGPTLHYNSFPSGHSVTAFALAALFTHFFTKKYKYIFLIIATSIAWSRVVVGAHWPADVIIGGVIGWYSTLFAIHIAYKWNWGVSNKIGLFTMTLLSVVTSVNLWFYASTYPHATLFARTLSLIAIVFVLRRIYQDYIIKYSLHELLKIYWPNVTREDNQKTSNQ